MSLEFNRVVEQVYKMGAMLEKLDSDLTESVDIAKERFEKAGDVDAVWERINWVRSSDISGYRGAAPLNTPNAEPINGIFPEPPMPDQALILAADGGQVYPDELASVHYYLINVGLFAYHHGQGITPAQYLPFPSLNSTKTMCMTAMGR